MEDLQPEFTITNTAVSALHSRLDAYRDGPFDEEVGVVLYRKLDDAWRSAREQEQRHIDWIRGGKVGPEVPTSVFQIHDREESDYSVEAWKLAFQDGDRTTHLLGVVTADTRRRDRRDGRVLKTVLSYTSAKAAIMARRWLNRDGTPITLPATAPRPVPAPESAPVPESSAPATVTSAPTPAPAPPIKLASDGRPAKGYRRGGASTDRDAFVLALLQRNPKMPTMGTGGIHELVKTQFGVGMRGAHVNKLRVQVLLEKAATPAVTVDLLDALDDLLRAEAEVATARHHRDAALRTLDRIRGLTAARWSAPRRPSVTARSA